MAKFVALYERPDDIEGFEEHYRGTHLPLVEQWPNLQSYSVTRATGTPRGTEPPYHLVFEATFASEEDLQTCLRSEAMRAAGKDAAEASQRYGVKTTMLIGTEF